jgi:hypothetical protein
MKEIGLEPVSFSLSSNLTSSVVAGEVTQHFTKEVIEKEIKAEPASYRLSSAPSSSQKEPRDEAEKADIVVEPTSSPLSSPPSSSSSSEEETEDSHLDLNENESKLINENVHESMEDVAGVESSISDNLALEEVECGTINEN